MLLRWNPRMNLTAIRNEEEIVTRHFGESLFAARHLFPKVHPVSPVVKDLAVAEARSPKAAAQLADIGSGAGFPGIPIKLWAPHVAVTLIESNQKKATFLREIVHSLTLTDINIQNIRAETLSPSSFDVVTLRAVERLNAILPVALKLLPLGGQLALFVSSLQLEATRSTLTSVDWEPPIPIPNSQARLFLVGRSIGAS